MVSITKNAGRLGLLMLLGCTSRAGFSPLAEETTVEPNSNGDTAGGGDNGQGDPGDSAQCEYAYRRTLVIDAAQVTGTIDLLDFPLLVSIASDDDLRTTSNGGHVSNDSGFDIVFRNSATESPLHHEIEEYVAETGRLVAWVRLSTLQATTDTTLFLDYGNPCVDTAQVSAGGVWDDTYRGVWHLRGRGVTPRLDQTTRGNDGAPQDYEGDETSTAGIISGAETLDGSDHLEVPHHGNLDVASVTLSAWVRTSVPSQSIIAKAGQDAGNQWLGLSSADLDSHCGDDATHTLASALDGTEAWRHNNYHLHWFILDLGQSYPVTRFNGRSADNGGGTGNGFDPIRVDIFVAETTTDWGAAVASNISDWQNTIAWQAVDTIDKVGRYVRMEIPESEDGISARIVWGNYRDGPPFTVLDVEVDGSISDVPYSLSVDANGYAVFRTIKGVSQFGAIGDTNIADGQWHYLVGTYASGSGDARIYVDGSTQNIVVGPAGGLAVSEGPLRLGAGYMPTAEDFFDGMLDEVRVDGTARSPEWIRAEYDNQRAPHTFVTIGPETTL